MDFVIGKYKELNSSYTEEYPLWLKISDDICAEAVIKGSGDNVSAIFVIFDNMKSIIQ